MKIQCACGTKVAFDVTPEMARTRVQFVCPNCGQDSSDLVNELIRREFATGPGAPPPIEIAPAPAAAAGPPPSPPIPRPVTVSVRPTATPAPRPIIEKPAPIAVSTRTSTSSGVRVGDNARAAATSKFCPKHPGQRTTHECVVCHKPICPKCMQVFGYLCSAFCKERAELQGIDVPVYAGQKDVAARGEFKHARLVVKSITAAVVVVLGVWIWYDWFASVPRPVFSLRFDQATYSGASRLAPDNQLIFLHGLNLARYDIKTKKNVWSFDIMTSDEITNVATIAREQLAIVRNRAVDRGEDAYNIPTTADMISEITRGQAEDLGLHVVGKNVWVSSFRRLTRYDFDTGKRAQVIALDNADRVEPHGDEILLISDDQRNGQETVKHVKLATGDTQEEVVPIDQNPDAEPVEGRHGGQPGEVGDLDPEEIAAQYSGMSKAEQIALPATLSVAINQQAALKEMRDDDQGNRPQGRPHRKAIAGPIDQFQTILTSHGAVQFSQRLLQENITEHVAMKDPPKKSIIDGNLTAGNSLDASAEILNQMRRDQGGATATEDDSSYQVIVRRTDTNSAPDWRGEVIGPPHFYPLRTVDVVAGNRTIAVLDQNNKELWKADLAFIIGGGGMDFFAGRPGDAGDNSPCVERGDSLYVFDQGVLTAFDLATGNVRWRLPSVGISAMRFNDDGMLYVSTTTASPDTIKYSHQIDIANKTLNVLLKIDPKDGKILWSVIPDGHVAYMSGKYIYTLGSFTPREDDRHPYEMTTGFETPPYTQIQRIDPKSGKMLWEYFQQRGPLDVQFDKNTIELVFKKEVVVLKYFTL